ncbi:MAG: sugar phosphate isomerase/epimerase [Chitinophagaceae bacterium]|nr:MAG: sugar phosphate isomerase/epimerase [Chitinophagaceae bacterium]
MQIGISTYSFPWSFGVTGFTPPELFTYKDLLLVAAKNKIRYVQFGDNYPLDKLPGEELESLKQLAEELQINIQVGARGLTVLNVNNYIVIARRLNSSFVRIVIDNDDYQPTEDEVIGIISDIIPGLQRAKVKLLIENHDRFKAHVLKRIIDNINSTWIGICLDTTNSLGAGEGIQEVVELLAPYTINLHIKDFNITRVEHRMGFKVNGCIAGEGMLDIPWLLKEIDKHGKCETATLELWSEPDQTIELTIRKEKIWADKSIDYLKTLIT